MSRPRKSAVPLVVDIDGVEVPASLRPPKTEGNCWHVRWRMHGIPREVSTGAKLLEEAKRAARLIIRSGRKPVAPSVRGGMTVPEFEAIQNGHFGLNARDEAGSKSRIVFTGVWRSFLSAFPIKTIQEVSDVMAADYLTLLIRASKTQNHDYKTKSDKQMSVATVRKHVRTLAAAWNRVRKGHRAKKGGIPESKLVTGNPWEEIRNNLPEEARNADPVQFDLDRGDLRRFLDQFAARPIAELFLITSLWCAGRIQEISRMEWGWWNGDYLDIPDAIAKRGRGKIVRVPSRIKQRLEEIRVAGSPFVFAGFAKEVERNLQSCQEVLPFAPERMVERLEKYIKKAAEAIGCPEISHHALRRTAMELSDEGELRAKEKASAEKLQTTVGNKSRNYIKRKGKKAIAMADGLYENLVVSLQDYPDLAERLGCDPVEIMVEREMDALMKKLTPIQRRRFQKRLGDSGDKGEGQGVA
jgi:integrase